MIVKRRFRPVHCRFMKYETTFPGASQQTGCPAASLCFEVVSLMPAFVLTWNSKRPFSLLFHLWLSLSGAAAIVHCVWGWTRAHPWAWNGGKHLSGIKPLPCSHCNDRKRLMKVHFIHSSLLVVIHHQNVLAFHSGDIICPVTMWFFCCLSYRLLQIYINFVNSQTFEYAIWGDKWRYSFFFSC